MRTTTATTTTEKATEALKIPAYIMAVGKIKENDLFNAGSSIFADGPGM